MQKRFFFQILMCLPGFLLGNGNKKIEPLPIGNFSVPLMTQIAPLVSFGQLLVGEKTFLPQLSGFYDRGHNRYTDVIAPNVIYGIREDLSVFFLHPLHSQESIGLLSLFWN